MYLSAYLFLVASFLCAVFFSGALAAQLLTGRTGALPWAERVQGLITVCMSLSSLILLWAFVSYDFSVEYVAHYSSTTLPLFYRITAFWAGQAGSLLFWAWSVALGGAAFSLTGAYKRLSVPTRMWFWMFFLAIMAFFLLLLTAWSNPFVTISPAPAEGNGLNPLLQNPGMIFHPPLLFLGYGGFVVPGCLALAQCLRGGLDPGRGIERPWSELSRPFIMLAWLLLTAGIILGAWWAYMELGWGGYWAWDPVENASLIPWLVATAYLHTGVVESRRGKLRRWNVFLMALTTISAFFATYLVRSGVVQSLHAFGDGGVGAPLLIFTLLFLAVAICVAAMSEEQSPPLAGIFSREGLLVLVAWVLMALSCVILIATMWPVIIDGLIAVRDLLPAALASRLPEKPMGLEPAFYNQRCLPLFAALAVLLLYCPQLKWREGMASRTNVLFLTGLAAVSGGIMFFAGLGDFPVALAASAAALCAIVGLFLTHMQNPALLRSGPSLAAHGVHLGFLIMVIGVAFSGPYQVKQNLVLHKGESAQVDGYSFTLAELYEGSSAAGPTGVPNYQFLEAELHVSRDNTPLGALFPQRRLYTGFTRQTYAEVATRFSLGKELYATLLSLDAQGRATIAVHINPLVNWLWIGGVIMCLLPVFGLARPRRSRDAEETATPSC